MTALHRLRCPVEGCADPKRLEAPSPPDGTLRCASCSTSTPAVQLFRPYAKGTGNLFISAALVFALGFQYTTGLIRDGVFAASSLLAVIAIYRIIWQFGVLRQARGG